MRLRLGTYYTALEGIEEDQSAFDTEKTVVDPDAKPAEDTTVVADIEEDSTEARVVPEIGSMEVDAEYKEQEDKDEAVVEALESISSLTEIANLINKSVSSNSKLDSTAASIANLALEEHRKRLMFKKTSIVSMESYSENKYHVVLEGFTSTISNIFKQIIELIKKSIEWLKKFFFALKDAFNKHEEVYRATLDKVLDQRKDTKDKENLVSKHKKYGYDSKHYIQSPELSAVLTIGNEQVDSYVDAFKDILALIESPKSGRPLGFDEFFEKTFNPAVSDLIEKEIKGDTTSTATIRFNLREFVTPSTSNQQFVRSQKDIHVTEFNGIRAQQGCVFYMQNLMLGNSVLYHQYNDFFKDHDDQQVTTLPVKDALEKLKGWTIRLGVESPGGHNDGFLRDVTTSEIESVAMVISSIYTRINEYTRNIDTINDLKAKLAKMLESATNISQDDANKMTKLSTAELIASVINTLRANADASIAARFKYATSTCVAWTKYLNEIYIKEAKLKLQE